MSDEALARMWARTPVVRVTEETPFPAAGRPALEQFLTSVRGMRQPQWDAYASSGAISPHSAATDEQNLAALRTGARQVVLVDDQGEGPRAAEQKALEISRAGFVAYRYRETYEDQVVHNVVGARDASTGAAIVAVTRASPSPERAIALGTLLDYEPRDVAHFVDRSCGFDGVAHLLGS